MKKIALGLGALLIAGVSAISAVPKQNLVGPYYFQVIGGVVQSQTVSSATEEPNNSGAGFGCGTPALQICAEQYTSYTRTQTSATTWRLDPAGTHNSANDLYKP